MQVQLLFKLRTNRIYKLCQASLSFLGGLALLEMQAGFLPTVGFRVKRFGLKAGV